MTQKWCFAPVVNDKTRVIILGSLPGEASLQAGQYYAHARNQFWRLLGDILQVPLATTQDYGVRLSLLQENGIGLWDVIASAKRQGSLDTALRDVKQNNLNDCLAQLRHLQLVAFNGCTAWRAAHQLKNRFFTTVLRLPSSSPAYTLSYQDKLDQWKGIIRYL